MIDMGRGAGDEKKWITRPKANPFVFRGLGKWAKKVLKKDEKTSPQCLHFIIFCIPLPPRSTKKDACWKAKKKELKKSFAETNLALTFALHKTRATSSLFHRESSLT